MLRLFLEILRDGGALFSDFFTAILMHVFLVRQQVRIRYNLAQNKDLEGKFWAKIFLTFFRVWHDGFSRWRDVLPCAS